MTMDYPVYEKNGHTQLAASAEAEVRLRFNGWRKREDPAEQPPDPAPAGEHPTSAPPAAGKAKQRSKNPTTD